MSEKDRDKEIEKQIDESKNNQVNNDKSDVFSRNITKMQAPEEWPDLPKETDSKDED